MASKGLRAISCQVTQKLKRATNLRIPLKPLLAIPRDLPSNYLKRFYLFLGETKINSSKSNNIIHIREIFPKS